MSFVSNRNFYAHVCRKYTHNHIDVENYDFDFSKLATDRNIFHFFFNTNGCVARDCVAIFCLSTIVIFWSHN